MSLQKLFLGETQHMQTCICTNFPSHLLKTLIWISIIKQKLRQELLVEAPSLVAVAVSMLSIPRQKWVCPSKRQKPLIWTSHYSEEFILRNFQTSVTEITPSFLHFSLLLNSSPYAQHDCISVPYQGKIQKPLAFTRRKPMHTSYLALIKKTIWS